MRTKEEIQEMIEKCKELRKYIPHFSAFGTNNWKSLDVNAAALTACLDKDEDDIEERLKQRLDVVGDDWSDDPEIQAYDWLIRDTDDLATDEDITCFKKKSEENS